MSQEAPAPDTYSGWQRAVPDRVLEMARREVRRVDGVLDITTDALEAVILVGERETVGRTLAEVRTQLAMLTALIEARGQQDAELVAFLPVLKAVVRRQAEILESSSHA